MYRFSQKVIFPNPSILYTYIKGNQLSSVYEGLSGSFTYDANGNATSDGTRGIQTISYNHMNLPASVIKGGNVVASYLYDGMGIKLRSVQGLIIRDYVSGIQYSGSGTIDFIGTEEGKAVRNTDGTYRYEYNLKDHLGNVRVTIDNSGGLGRRVIQEDEYYAFGVSSNRFTSGDKNNYLYNGKELQDVLSNEYDYGARMYDPVIGSWNAIDPLSEKMSTWSPYTYAFNNPIRFIDVGGEYPWPVTVRSFISTPTTGGGHFYGDGRGASFGGTSRVYSSFVVDPSNRNVSQPITRSDPTILYGATLPGVGSLPPNVGVGSPSGSNDNIGFSDGTASFDFNHSGKDPLTLGLLTPALDVQAGLTFNEDLKKGVLSINGSFTGDTFPSTEAFITDQSGNGKVFLGARRESGGIKDLFGNNKNPSFKVNMKVQFGKDGNFTGVKQGKTTYTVDEWNKKVHDDF